MVEFIALGLELSIRKEEIINTQEILSITNQSVTGQEMVIDRDVFAKTVKRQMNGTQIYLLI